MPSKYRMRTEEEKQAEKEAYAKRKQAQQVRGATRRRIRQMRAKKGDQLNMGRDSVMVLLPPSKEDPPTKPDLSSGVHHSTTPVPPP